MVHFAVLVLVGDTATVDKNAHEASLFVNFLVDRGDNFVASIIVSSACNHCFLLMIENPSEL